jgi:hypothetical protein
MYDGGVPAIHNPSKGGQELNGDFIDRQQHDSGGVGFGAELPSRTGCAYYAFLRLGIAYVAK